jgi:adenylosuccinate lyase
MLKGAREEVLLPRMRALIDGCAGIAERLAHAPLMGRTQ